MQAGSSGGGVGNDFLKRVDDAGFDRTGVAHVDEAGHLASGGETEHAEDFFARNDGHIGDAEADAERSRVQTGLHQIVGLADFRGGGVLGDGAVTRQEHAGIVKDGHAGGDVAGRRAEVDERATGAGAIPGLDGVDADFHFKRGGDAVAGFEAVILISLAVGMEVDETGGDDESGDVDDLAAGERLRTDGGDLSGGNGEVARCVETGFGIDHAAAGEDGVVLLGECAHERKKGQSEQAHWIKNSA